MERARDPDAPFEVGADPPGSCDVSDACDRLDLDALRSGAFRPLWSGCAGISGHVRTVRLEPAATAASPLAELLDVLASARGSVVLIDLGERLDVQCWGTVLASAAQSFGVRGTLVNGAARDIDGLQELAFPTYARGVYPGGMRGRLRLAAVDRPVELDGRSVDAGSFAVVDASGAVFVPAARADEVVALAATRRRRERALLEQVAAGADARAVFHLAQNPDAEEGR